MEVFFHFWLWVTSWYLYPCVWGNVFLHCT